MVHAFGGDGVKDVRGTVDGSIVADGQATAGMAFDQG